jgi:hypothetical protein
VPLAAGNRWLLHTALSRSDTDVRLIVLRDGRGGDAPGHRLSPARSAVATFHVLVYADGIELPLADLPR